MELADKINKNKDLCWDGKKLKLVYPYFGEKYGSYNNEPLK